MQILLKTKCVQGSETQFLLTHSILVIDLRAVWYLTVSDNNPHNHKPCALSLFSISLCNQYVVVLCCFGDSGIL